MPAHLRFQKVLRTHAFTKALKVTHQRYAKTVLHFTLDLLIDDLGPQGDITTALFEETNKLVQARLIAKSSGILAGEQEIIFFLQKFGKVKCRFMKHDGDQIKNGETFATLTGKLVDVLVVERTILNLLQRMCGIATLTRQYADGLPSSVLLTPTRKTLYGLLDKRACVVGGGGTHRLGLSDAVLIKDTHLDANHHNFRKIFDRLFKTKLKGRFIEIEVETLADAHRVVQLYASNVKLFDLYLMLDNMLPATIKKFMEWLKTQDSYLHVFVEASGGINLSNIKKYAATGVDIISVGALTHSAPIIDISLKIDS